MSESTDAQESLESSPSGEGPGLDAPPEADLPDSSRTSDELRTNFHQAAKRFEDALRILNEKAEKYHAAQAQHEEDTRSLETARVSLEGKVQDLEERERAVADAEEMRRTAQSAMAEAEQKISNASALEKTAREQVEAAEKMAAEAEQLKREAASALELVDARVSAAELHRTDAIRQLKAMSEQFDDALEARALLEKRLRDLERALGPNLKAVDVQRELESNRHTIARLQAELDGSIAIEEFERQRQRADDREREASELRRRIEEMADERLADGEAERLNARVAELRSSNESLNELIRSYEATTAKLKEALAQLTSASKTESTSFPQCSHAWTSNKGVAADPLEFPWESLADFAEFLRGAMMRPSRESEPYFYEEREIRSLLGGLAATRLHILEGQSGTGKSSLVQRFCNAVAGQFTNIPVQSGWNDRTDLVGYYNTFDRVYQESDLIQHMFQAWLPGNQDRLSIVLLDEMNLSPVEYYWADFVGALEQEAAASGRRLDAAFKKRLESAPCIQLTNRSLHDLPPYFNQRHPDRARVEVAGGVRLPVPPNLWFMGTGNQDHTTQTISPKIYDRAHVAALKEPDQSQDDEVKAIAPKPVSAQLLMKQFELATQAHRDQTSRALAIVTEAKESVTAKVPTSAFGKRLANYTGSFVPVVLAAGGTIDEAVDEVIASRLIARLAGNDLLTKDQVEELMVSEGLDRPRTQEALSDLNKSVI